MKFNGFLRMIWRLAVVLFACNVLQACGEESVVVAPRENAAPMSASVRLAIAMLDQAAWREPAGSTAEQIARELIYTRRWLAKTLPAHALEVLGGEALHPVAGVGPSNDEAIVGNYTLGGDAVEVVDGRVLLVRVTSKETVGDVLGTFRRVIDYYGHLDRRRIVLEVREEGRQPDDSRWGVIRVDRERFPGWYALPVEWHCSGAVTMFVFSKVLTPPNLKGPIKPERAAEFLGGLDAADTRAFLRFGSPNRAELAQEQFAGWIATRWRKARVNPPSTEGPPLGR